MGCFEGVLALVHSDHICHGDEWFHIVDGGFWNGVNGRLLPYLS